MKDSMKPLVQRRPHSFKAIALVISLMVLPILVTTGTAQAASPLPVPLRSADSFGVLAGATITNTGPSTVNGDVGLHPGSAVTGFAPCFTAADCVTLNGSLHVADNVALAAKSDLVTAYNDAAGRTPPTPILTQLGGQTLPAGVYNSSSGTFDITGILTLDGNSDPASVFIFQTQSTLVTAAGAPGFPGSTVRLINQANACNVFWQVGSSATIGTYANFAGTILALAAVSVNTGATVNGRTLARNAAVTMDTNTIGSSVCPAPTSRAPVPGNIEVAKTHQFRGSKAVSTNAKWVFTLKNAAGTAFQCTHPNPSDTTKCTTNLNGNGPILRYLTLPADTYTLCEKAFGGWRTQFRSRPTGSSVSGRCMTFPLAAGQNLTSVNGTQLRVNNLCPQTSQQFGRSQRR